jgi:hypothetical protein
MVARVERGMSAPPEIVFNTATDPSRFGAWLPAPLCSDGTDMVAGDLYARWRPESNGWKAELQVRALDAGGASVRLELAGDLPDEQLADIADGSLAKLARHVADNLTAG